MLANYGISATLINVPQVIKFQDCVHLPNVFEFENESETKPLH